MINAHVEPTLEQFQQSYSDLYKEVNGFRPRPGAEAFNDIEYLKAEHIRLWDQLAEKQAQDKLNDEAAAHAFEQLVAATIKNGAKNRATAIRWLMEAEDVNGDEDFFKFKMHLPYSYDLRIS